VAIYVKFDAEEFHEKLSNHFPFNLNYFDAFT
jgi:hypothetical protein